METVNGMATRSGFDLLWVLAAAAIVWVGVEGTEYWHERQEIKDFSYAQLAHDYPTSSAQTKTMVRAAMAKGYIASREYQAIVSAILTTEHNGIVMRSADQTGDPDSDKKRLADLIRDDRSN